MDNSSDCSHFVFPTNLHGQLGRPLGKNFWFCHEGWGVDRLVHWSTSHSRSHLRNCNSGIHLRVTAARWRGRLRGKTECEGLGTKRGESVSYCLHQGQIVLLICGDWEPTDGRLQGLMEQRPSVSLSCSTGGVWIVQSVLWRAIGSIPGIRHTKPPIKWLPRALSRGKADLQFLKSPPGITSCAKWIQWIQLKSILILSSSAVNVCPRFTWCIFRACTRPIHTPRIPLKYLKDTLFPN
jgi:hypothetical protein